MNIVEREVLRQVSAAPTQTHQTYQTHQMAAVTHSQPEGMSFDVILDIVRRRFWIILFCSLFATVGAIGYLVLVPAPYTAVATLAIDTSRFQLFGQGAGLGERAIDSGPAVESQLEIIRSENIALSVIASLRLADDPEFGHRFTIGRLFGRTTNYSEDARTANALRAFENSLAVKRLGGAFIIEISFGTNNPQRSAEVANAIAEAYIQDQLEARYGATRQGSKWLEGRLEELRKQVATAQRAVLDYKAQHNIVDAGQGRLTSDQQVAELNTQLTVARARAQEVRARLDRVNRILKEASNDAIIGAGGEIIDNNPLITKLRAQYLEAASRQSEWSKSYGGNHAAAVNLRNTMHAIGLQIRSELTRTKEAYENDVAVATESERNLEMRLQQSITQSQVTSDDQVQLRDLEATALTYKGLYDNFLRRYTEAVEQQSFPHTEARIITKASPPSQRNYRRTIKFVALIPFAGLILGCGIAAAREFLDKGIRTTSQVETLLETDCLAMVPARDSAQPGGVNPVQMSVITDSPNASPGSEKKHSDLHVEDQPFSAFTESIRSVKLAIDINGDRVIGVTSSVPDEGKSTIAVALAQLIARVGARVILVDCDWHNPSLSRGIVQTHGCNILHVLGNQNSLQQAILNDPTTNLDYLPADTKMRIANTSEILASSLTRKLFEQLRQTYDYIVVDLPPLAPIVDVRATTHLVDAYLLVVEWGRTSPTVAQHALSRAPYVREKLLGAILNKVDMKQLELYDRNRFPYYNEKAFSRYGYTS